MAHSYILVNIGLDNCIHNKSKQTKEMCFILWHLLCHAIKPFYGHLIEELSILHKLFP